MNKEWIQKRMISFLMIFWIFFIGSFCGFLAENLITILNGKWILRQGLIYEPLIPVYGIGLSLLYILYRNFNRIHSKNFLYWVLLFLCTSFLGGFVEYVCSFLQEKIFGTVSWSYFHMRFNINGRTTLFHSMFWGFAMIPFALWFFPHFQKLENIFYHKIIFQISIFFLVFFSLDVALSFSATLRQTERREHIEANNVFERFLDQKYPDERLEKIYNNAKVVE